MNQDVYEKLAAFLDKMPGGFPRTESDVEIKILKKFFTPEQAELTTHLSMMPEPVSTIAERTGAAPDKLARDLEQMAKQGSIYRVRLGGKSYYMAIDFVIGIYEFHLNTIDRELAELFEQYIPHLAATWTEGYTGQLRVSPSMGSVNASPAVETYDNLRELVKKQTKLGVAPCICRKEQGLLGHPCKKPHETCLVFGFAADYYLENGMGREIDVNEALAILDLAEETGLVASPSNYQEIMNICLCCGCCCGILRSLKLMPRPSHAVHSSYLAKIDADLCAACGDCLERCQMEAIIEGDSYQVDEDRCIGCGLCVATCPQEAISLELKPQKYVPPKSKPELSVKIMRERGLMK